LSERKQTNELLTEISSKLDKVSKLLTLNLVKDQEKQKDKIIALAGFGYGVTDISEMLDTTTGTVNQTLVRFRKERKGKSQDLDKKQAETGDEGKTTQPT
jgi:DNA-directed RNA polymerase specialized sigma24 family protein